MAVVSGFPATLDTPATDSDPVDRVNLIAMAVASMQVKMGVDLSAVAGSMDYKIRKGYRDFADAIQAFVGGGQTITPGNAAILTKGVNRVTTVASLGDSLNLPVSAPGLSITVINSAASNACDVFPFLGDIINTLAANTAVRIAAGTAVTFYCTVAGTWITSPYSMAPAQFVTGTTTTTFAAGQLTGAQVVCYANTGNAPGSIATRTATQMFADTPNAQVGQSYLLRIYHGGTGTLTVTAGTGVTLTGTATIATTTFRDFIVTFTSATALVMQNIGAGDP